MEIHTISEILNPFSKEITDSDLLLYHGTSQKYEKHITNNGFQSNFDTYNESQIKKFCEIVIRIDSKKKEITDKILHRYSQNGRTRTSFTADFERACYYAIKRKGGFINDLINQVLDNISDDHIHDIKHKCPLVCNENNALNNSKCVIFAITLNDQVLSSFSSSLHGAIHLNKSLQSNFIKGKAILDSNLKTSEPTTFVDQVTFNSPIFQKINS
jgi:hypothetical protein